MSLAIDVNNVKAILIAGEWHHVAKGSFNLDAYEFVLPHPNPDKDPIVLHGGGQSGITATGFSFVDGDGDVIYGPLTSIQAVACRK